MLDGHIIILAPIDILYDLPHFIVNYMKNRIFLVIFLLVTGLNAGGIYQKIINTLDP